LKHFINITSRFLDILTVYEIKTMNETIFKEIINL